MADEARPIPVWCFVLVVVREGDRFLMVHERKFGQRWCVPAGRVERGETFAQAALRETLEETGVAVRLEGVLRIEHLPTAKGSTRIRVIFLARPEGDAPPKCDPDEHSLGAAWLTLEQVDPLPLRGEGIRPLLRAVAAGAPVYPLDLIAREGEPMEPPSEA